MFMHNILIENGDWVQSDDNIAKEACQYYQNIFTSTNYRINEDILHCIPDIVTKEQNIILESIHIMEKLRSVIFAMHSNSSPFHDGIGSKFYQSCFDIIKKDLLAVVKSYFNGQDMPSYMTDVCLILLLKVVHPKKLKDYRPISFSYFYNKINSTIMSIRLDTILPSLIYDNQSSFIRGRIIY